MSAGITDGHDPVAVATHLAKGRRLPMRFVEQVHGEAGVGQVGDRYHGSRHRHVSVQSLEELAEGSEPLGPPVPPEGTRRNVTLSRGRVPTRPGTPVCLGGALLEVVRKAAPCRILDDEITPGAAQALHDRAGTILRASWTRGASQWATRSRCCLRHPTTPPPRVECGNGCPSDHFRTHGGRGAETRWPDVGADA